MQRRVERVRDARRLRPHAARRRSARAIASTAASAPEITTELGPVDRRDRHRAACGATASATSASVAAIETIAPPRGSACISRPRAATSRAASSSENTPATYAAASSPMLWPSNEVGLDAPRPPQRRERDLEREQRRLRVRGLVESARRVAVGPHHRRAAGGRGGGRSAATRARASSRNTGHAAASPRPMPSTCAPWPVNRNASRARGARRARDPSASRRASASSAAASSLRASRPPRADARGACAPVARVDATSRERELGCVAQVRCRAARPLRERGSAAAPTARPARPVRAGAGATATVPAPPASTTCAFVPLKPKELTPATRRAPACAATAIASRATRTGSSAHGDVRARRVEVQALRDPLVLEREHAP